jgi:molecular chaperone DnaK (HSP70)
MSTREKDWFVVIGIDFGTTYSGFSYAFSDEDKVHNHGDWGIKNNRYTKTKSQLLYIKGEPRYWGHPAVVKHVEMHNSQEEAYRIMNFKMQLGQKYYTQSGIPKEEFMVIDLVSDYLRFIKDKALEVVGSKTVRNVKDNVIWCLTVPAIWTNAQKNEMRMAAQKAGMISGSDNDYHKLILVYEPEAAAVYCRQKQSVGLEENDCFMIVDCGGGTVDITTRKVDKNNNSLVLNAIQGVTPDGGPYGSTYVDSKFMTFLSDKITPKALDHFREEHPMNFLTLYDTWEQVKIVLSSSDFNTGISFEIPAKLRSFLAMKYPNILEEIKKTEGDDDTNITIRAGVLKDFFAETLNGLVIEVEKQFQRLGNRKCDYIILVGGYSDCPLLQERIKEKFNSKVKKIIQDSNPGGAIMEGAGWLGLHPNLNPTRTSNLTYGVNCVSVFQPGDPENKKIRIDGEPDRCDDILLAFVEAGDLVGIDETREHKLNPIYPHQKVIECKFYSTPERNARHINSNMILQGNKEFEREDTTKGKDWTIKITMYFGRCEIGIEIEDLTTHEIQRLKLDFRHTL